ncbi:ABC transporter permease [Frateuria soli]|uniref:ABC transporter permease n=1 Tax=Frateuria soli TaxID=1542730 RepID=UPI001E4EB4D3|nr:ABC transporter permease [Frateuria soli]UGB37457.1 ABC transporter permease [Frateuria soli]
MFAYYLDLALRSLRRSPVLTSLMVLAIGLGIGASMTMLTVLHVMTRDPLPELSAQLYYPHLDPLPANYPSHNEWGDPSDNFTWPDAMALLKAHRADQQAAMAGGRVLAWPVQAGRMPFRVGGRYATAGFFELFGLRFEQGRGWTAADDEARARLVVLSHALAMKLFGRTDVVGRTVRLGDARFQVTGVTADWAPQPQFYADGSGRGNYGESDRFFLPLATALDLDLSVSGNQASWKEGGRTSGNYTWLQVWVRLKDAAQARAYRQFLVDYSASQQKLGRFERPPGNAALYPMMGWLAHQKLVPNDLRLQLWLALGFLVVCLVNIVALLLAKFLRRSGEVSVRRALGARRRDIFVQFGVEAALVGSLGGLLGVAIAQAGLWSVRQRPDSYAHVARMDLSMLALTVLLAIAGSLLAGMLPAWRASRVAPALQLKAQ